MGAQGVFWCQKRLRLSWEVDEGKPLPTVLSSLSRRSFSKGRRGFLKVLESAKGAGMEAASEQEIANERMSHIAFPPPLVAWHHNMSTLIYNPLSVRVRTCSRKRAESPNQSPSRVSRLFPTAQPPKPTRTSR